MKSLECDSVYSLINLLTFRKVRPLYFTLLVICLFAFSAYLWILKTEAASYSETLVNFCHTTRCQIPEDSSLYNVLLIWLFKINVFNFNQEFTNARYLFIPV
jgi:uncharacterized membrane protein